MPITKKYVALLRGINVGGNNIIKMNDLRKCFEKLGYSDVMTYIASGNVIFSTGDFRRDTITKTIEKTLRKQFRYKAVVVLRSKDQIKATVRGFPRIFKDSTWKHNVIFLGDEIDHKSILGSLELKDGIESLKYSKGVLYWSAQMKTITKSNMLKLSSKPEYQRMTVRSQNTTKKILELMEK